MSDNKLPLKLTDAELSDVPAIRVVEGDAFALGRMEDLIELAKECEGDTFSWKVVAPFEGVVYYHVEDVDENYWGTGKTEEEALRFMLGAVLDPRQEFDELEPEPQPLTPNEQRLLELTEARDKATATMKHQLAMLDVNRARAALLEEERINRQIARLVKKMDKEA